MKNEKITIVSAFFVGFVIGIAVPFVFWYRAEAFYEKIAGPSLYIQYRETGCEGTCPVYSLTIDDSQGIFKGQAYVSVMGEKYFRVSRADRLKLQRALLDNHIFTLPSEEEMMILDAPEGVLTAVLGEASVRSSFTLSGSENFERFHNVLLEVTGASSWIAE